MDPGSGKLLQLQYAVPTIRSAYCGVGFLWPGRLAADYGTVEGCVLCAGFLGTVLASGFEEGSSPFIYHPFPSCNLQFADFGNIDAWDTIPSPDEVRFGQERKSGVEVRPTVSCIRGFGLLASFPQLDSWDWWIIWQSESVDILSDSAARHYI
jgi:hypothetical protein